MNLQIISEELFTNFTKQHELGTFLQTIEEKKLKECYKNKCYLVGLFQDNEIVGATLLLEIPAKFGKTIFYAPRGFLTDYHNKTYIKSFTENLVFFAKQHKALELIIDPYIIYQIRGKEGIESETKNDEIINYLKSLGYHHFGFNQNFETSQVRFMYRIPLLSTYEDTIQTFSKSTRKRIEEVEEKAVKVKTATKEDLEKVVDLLKASATNKHFEFRSVAYYQNMMDAFHDDMKIYIAYIDFEEEQKKAKELLEQEKQNLTKIQLEMSKVNVGSKLLKKEEQAKNHIQKYEQQLKEAIQNQEQYGKTLEIGTLVSMKSNQEYITLSSGMLTEFRSYNPKYAMYQAHIKDAIQEGFQYVNFYGISGNFDPKSELYGIYDLKRGFNGEIVELIGEFSYPISHFAPIYHFLLKVKEKIKK